MSPSARMQARAFAPASVGNVGVGFDILGLAVDALGDTVRATRRAAPGVAITAIGGVETELPREPERNTAGRAAQALLEEERVDWGVELEIVKGIPLGSGLGGSAASAVAAVVAVNALLERPREPAQLVGPALEGECVASGARHADNVAPSLLGGLVLCLGPGSMRLERVPVPRGVRVVLAHPRMFLSTRAAREILRPEVPLALLVRQSANLAGFLAACYTDRAELLRFSLEDVVVEPQRARLIPGFVEARAAALAAGALGGSISGAGPSSFFLALEDDAERVRAAVVAALQSAGHGVDHWIVPLESPGARVLAP